MNTIGRWSNRNRLRLVNQVLHERGEFCLPCCETQIMEPGTTDVHALIADLSWIPEIRDPEERMKAARVYADKGGEPPSIRLAAARQAASAFRAVSKARRLGAEPYQPEDINGYGDVTVVRSGWIEVSLQEPRGAPLRYTLLVGLGGTRRDPKTVKRAVVPQSWWEQGAGKLSLHQESMANTVDKPGDVRGTGASLPCPRPSQAQQPVRPH
jgi:hypothetical protein